jgi:hypothetical protein
MFGLGLQQQQLDLSKLSNSQQYELAQAKLALEQGQLSIAQYNAETQRIAANRPGAIGGGGGRQGGGQQGGGTNNDGSGVNLSDLFARYKVGGNPMANSGNAGASAGSTTRGPAQYTDQEDSYVNSLLTDLGIPTDRPNNNSSPSYFVDNPGGSSYAPNDSGVPSNFDEYLFGSG